MVAVLKALRFSGHCNGDGDGEVLTAANAVLYLPKRAGSLLDVKDLARVPAFHYSLASRSGIATPDQPYEAELV